MKKIPKSEIRNPKFCNERGVALVMVLWIFMFLFVMAFSFSFAVREEGLTAHRYVEESEAYYLALAGFEDGLYRLLSNPPGAQRVRPAGPSTQDQEVFDGTWREANLGEGVYRVRLVDEGGKVNLNRASEEVLRRVLSNLGIEQPLRDILVDSILDWRDDDNLHRASGAENDYYLSLVLPYTARNGPFDTIEELLWIRGVTPELYHGGVNHPQEGASSQVGLKEIFTVDSATDRVNLRTSSAEVIHAVLGIPIEKARSFVEERRKLSEKTLADLLRLLGISQADSAMRLFVFSNPSIVAIEAAGRRGNSAVERRVKGVVRLIGGSRGYNVMRWVDRDAG
ncbi:MAG: general secretion pathway protein GspK [Deltaproteobacteria bacterium]|nr:general secretion pathway protein GspK [Deltaproteobacteria bacterium]